jgi:Holliday junction resolvasome RuvABC endonuclease subunit
MKRAKRNRTQEVEELVIMVHDPSMTGWGWVVLSPEGPTILDHGTIKTKSEAKVRRIRKGDDKVRRVHDLNTVLIKQIRRYKVNYIISELPHGSKSATAAVMIGIVAGMIQTYSDLLGIPIEWYSENDAKQAVLGKNSATKQEIIDAISEEYEVDWPKHKYQKEAVADAMAIYHAALQQSSFLQFYSKNY